MVDFVSQNSIHRFEPSVTDELVLYRHHMDVLFSAYASAKQADILAFGLPNGLVRVMGGVMATQFLSPTVVAPPLPALPRYFEYLIKTAVLKLAFSPDGTSLAILYQSCLVVQNITNSNVKRVYYFGTEHSRVFMDLIHSDESVFLWEASGRVCRFSLVYGSFGHEVPPVVSNNVSALWTVQESTDKLITYDPEARRMKYMTYEFPDGLFLGDALPTDGIEPDFFMGCDEDGSFFWTAGPGGVQIFRTTSGESLATYRTNLLQDTTKFLVGFRALYAAEQVGEVVRFRKFMFTAETGEILVTDERELPFGDGKQLMELSRQVSLLTTRFQAIRPLYILQPIRIQNIVLNSHMFPVDESEGSGSDDESDDGSAADDEEDDETEVDDDDEEDVVAASFHFPQPLHGLQRIISLTRNCVENADAYIGMDPWTPEEFQRIRTACNRSPDVHYYPTKRLYARALMIIADVREVMQKIDTEIQKFVDFYGASATFGQFEFDDDDADDPAADDPYGFKREFVERRDDEEHVVALDLNGILRNVEGVKLTFTLDRVKLVEAIHDEDLVPLDAVNTGIISTLNCMKSQFKDVLGACMKYARGAKRLAADMRATRKRKAE
jgi:hypothetical protein